MSSYVIYARKSTESEDRQVVSIESQIKELKLLAARQGIQVAEVLTESRSAKRPGRPVFGSMMRRIHRGEIRGILCWKMDRLARNHLDHGTVLQALSDKLLDRIITIDRPYTPDGTDRFIGNFELGMATKYSDDLSQNVRRGIRARLEQGWCNHQPRLGYTIDPATRHIIADPDRFANVQRMLRLVLLGTMGIRVVLKIANSEWRLTTRKGMPVSRSTFYDMLQDPFYAGVIQLRDGRRYSGAHQPMITIDDFRRIQTILGRSGRPRPQKHSFPFTGIFKCGHCGGSITAEQHIKGNGRRYVYYRCSHRMADIECREPAISEPELLEQLASRLRFLQMPERIHAWLCRQALAQRASETERQEEIRRTASRALQGLDREESNLVDMRAREIITDDVLQAKLEGVRERRDSLRRQADNLNRRDSEGLTLVQAFTFSRRAPAILRNGTPVQQRMILEAVGLNYTLRAKKVAFQLQKPLQIIADAGALSAWSRCLDDVRNWMRTTSRPFRIPDLDMTIDSETQPLAEWGGVDRRPPGSGKVEGEYRARR
jgi:site-specific DNA recombinase